MRPTKRQMQSEFRAIEARTRASKAMRDARAALDFVMVAMIGYERPMPMTFGDNQGVTPVRVHTTKPGNYRALLKKLEAEQPMCRLRRYGYVWCGSDQHAKRLKARLDEALIGAAGRDLLQHWKDIADPELFWPLLLDQAAAEIRAGGERIEFYDDADVERVMRGKAFGGHHAR